MAFKLCEGIAFEDEEKGVGDSHRRLFVVEIIGCGNMLELFDLAGGVLLLPEPVFYDVPEGGPIYLLFKFGKGRHSVGDRPGSFLQSFHRFGVLCGIGCAIGCADKPLFLAVKFALFDLEGDDFPKLGRFGCGGYDGVGDATGWC